MLDSFKGFKLCPKAPYKLEYNGKDYVPDCETGVKILHDVFMDCAIRAAEHRVSKGLSFSFGQVHVKNYINVEMGNVFFFNKDYYYKKLCKTESALKLQDAYSSSARNALREMLVQSEEAHRQSATSARNALQEMLDQSEEAHRPGTTLARNALREMIYPKEAHRPGTTLARNALCEMIYPKEAHRQGATGAHGRAKHASVQKMPPMSFT